MYTPDPWGPDDLEGLEPDARNPVIAPEDYARMGNVWASKMLSSRKLSSLLQEFVKFPDFLETSTPFTHILLVFIVRRKNPRTSAPRVLSRLSLETVPFYLVFVANFVNFHEISLEFRRFARN